MGMLILDLCTVREKTFRTHIMQSAFPCFLLAILC